MTDKQKKITTIITVSGVLVLLIAVISLIINIAMLVGLSTKQAELEKKSVELAEVIENNDEEINYRASADYIEKYARDYLNMKYADEEVYEAE